MRVRVDLLPRAEYQGDVVVLIDVLRTCTTAPILFDRGLRRLILTPSLREARQAAAERGALLLGERGGVPPEGFNYGNSPAELAALDVAGKEAVMVSDNAPRVLRRLEGAREVFMGSLYNAAAVVDAAEGSGAEAVSLVCCGFAEQEDLDDALTAGFLASELRRRRQGSQLVGGAGLAVALLRAFPDPMEAFWHSTTGRYLRRLELADDLAVASLVSQSRAVPRLLEVAPGTHASRYHFEPTAP